MLKTYEEIVEKCRNPFSRFGHDIDVYLHYLPYKYAKEFLIGEDDSIVWDSNVIKPVEKNIFHPMRKYMDLVWSDIIAHNHRAVDEGVDHFIGWLWLLDNTELIEFALDENNYSKYGAPILAKICRTYNFLIQDGVLIQRMIKNKPCQPDCAQGCLG